MIGNGNITKFAHIEVSGCRPQWSLQRTIQTAPRFFLRYGLRPPLRKNLAPSPRRDMITLTCHSTWARKSTAGTLGWIHARRDMFGEKVASDYVEVFQMIAKNYGKEEAMVFSGEHMLPLNVMFRKNDLDPPSKEVILSFIERSKVNFIAELYSRPELFPKEE